MSNRLSDPNIQFLDNEGEPLVAGLLYFYITDTSTPTDTYNNPDLAPAHANQNPVVLDAAGRAGDIFLDSSVTYKCVLKDSAGSTIWTADPVTDLAANINAKVQIYGGNPNGNVAGSAGAIGAEGASIIYDTVGRVLYICTTTGTSSTAVWSVAVPGLFSSETIKTNDYTIALANNGQTVCANKATSIFITLPAPAVVGAGFVVCIKNINDGPVSTAGTTTDDGAALTLQKWDSVIVECNGSTWRIVGLYRRNIPVAPLRPGGRLTLSSGVPVLTSDVTAATTVYWTPWCGTAFPYLEAGSNWRQITTAELSLALDSNAGHTGYHQTGKNFDLFLTLNNTLPALVTGPAWSNDTARASAISLTDGIYVNTASMTVRYGSASIQTATLAAGQGTYVGTMRATADGTTAMTMNPAGASGGAAATMGLWNMYNRVRMKALVTDNGTTYTYTSATIQQARASAGNQINFVSGLAQETIEAFYSNTIQTTANAGSFAASGLALDSTVTFNDNAQIWTVAAAAMQGQSKSSYQFAPQIGYHYISANENSDATHANTFGSAASYQLGRLMANFMM